MKAKTNLAALLAATFTLGANAATTIEITDVKQRYPWNNKVDISYRIEGGQNVALNEFYKIVFTATIDGIEYTIDGDAVGASANEGNHVVTWRNAPSGVKSGNCTMSAKVYGADAPSGDDYMVIQLTGADAGKVTFEGLLATQEDSNTRYNVDTYKRDKMVLRKIPAAAGRYTTGHSTWSGNNVVKTWTTYRDYYVSIFAVTRQQSYVGNANPGTVSNMNNPWASNDTRWSTLRANTYVPTNRIPAVTSLTGSFFQKLNYAVNAKSGDWYYFDLPTEVMSEIARRAGSTSKYSWGDTADSEYEYTVYTGSGVTEVGTKKPNDWGLYDTSGNQWEWQLDDNIANDPPGNRTDPFTPAVADDSASARAWMGGGGGPNETYSNPNYGASSRASNAKDNSTRTFRVAYIRD